MSNWAFDKLRGHCDEWSFNGLMFGLGTAECPHCKKQVEIVQADGGYKLMIHHFSVLQTENIKARCPGSRLTVHFSITSA